MVSEEAALKHKKIVRRLVPVENTCMPMVTELGPTFLSKIRRGMSILEPS